MTDSFKELRPVYVVGVGLDRYGKLSHRTFVELGLKAIRAALADGRVPWQNVQSVYHGTLLLGSARAPGTVVCCPILLRWQGDTTSDPSPLGVSDIG